MDNMAGKVKIIFSDIDGTLLNSRHQITDSTRNKILELEQKGTSFVLASARMPEGVESIQRRLCRQNLHYMEEFISCL